MRWQVLSTPKRLPETLENNVYISSGLQSNPRIAVTRHFMIKQKQRRQNKRQISTKFDIQKAPKNTNMMEIVPEKSKMIQTMESNEAKTKTNKKKSFRLSNTNTKPKKRIFLE
jgi:hypothetical protein